MADVLDFQPSDGSYHEANLNRLDAISASLGGGSFGLTRVNKFGFNLDVDSASNEVLAAFGNGFQVMTSAEVLSCVSTSAEDAVGGTGASLILINGIDENNLLVEEYVTLTGLTPVNTVNTYLGVNRIFVVASGTNNSNVGNINVTSSTFSNQAQIPIGRSVTQQCIYHTPISTNFDVNFLQFSALKTSGGAKPEVKIYLKSYSRVTQTVYEVAFWEMDIAVENNLNINLKEAISFGGREVIYVEIDSSTDNLSISGRFSGIQTATT